MIGLSAILARWKWGLGLAGVLALAGLVMALQHYRSAYHAERALRKADRASYVAEQSKAAERAQAALRYQEHIYVTKARGIEHEYVSKIADARAAADRYIAAYRMRNQAVAGRASQAAASAEGRGARVPAEMPAASILVSEGDVRACTDLGAYAISAHEWAVGLMSQPATAKP